MIKKILISAILFAFFHIILNIENCNAQWVQMSNGMGTDNFIWSLAVNGNNIFAGTDSFGIYLSTDNGMSWNQTSLNNECVNSILTLGNYIFAGTGGNGIFLSTNNGTNWNHVGFDNKYAVSFAVIGNHIFAAVQPDGLYSSTDNGMNWVLTSLSCKYIVFLTTFENNILAGSFYGVFLSSNYGTNWTQISNTSDIFSLLKIGNNLFAGIDQHGVFISTNNGTNWNQTALGNISVYTLMSSNYNIFAGIDNYPNEPGGVYLTKNNGTNWLNINQGFNEIPSVNALLIVNNYIFAGTGNQSVWRRSLTEIIGIKQISEVVPTKYSLQQNYPNPFNPTTNIRYDLPKNSFVKIVVFDMLGREVETLVNEKQTPGLYEITWNALQYTSGVYFF